MDFFAVGVSNLVQPPPESNLIDDLLDGAFLHTFLIFSASIFDLHSGRHRLPTEVGPRLRVLNSPPDSKMYDFLLEQLVTYVVLLFKGVVANIHKHLFAVVPVEYLRVVDRKTYITIINTVGCDVLHSLREVNQSRVGKVLEINLNNLLVGGRVVF